MFVNYQAYGAPETLTASSSPPTVLLPVASLDGVTYTFRDDRESAVTHVSVDLVLRITTEPTDRVRPPLTRAVGPSTGETISIRTQNFYLHLFHDGGGYCHTPIQLTDVSEDILIDTAVTGETAHCPYQFDGYKGAGKWFVLISDVGYFNTHKANIHQASISITTDTSRSVTTPTIFYGWQKELSADTTGTHTFNIDTTDPHELFWWIQIHRSNRQQVCTIDVSNGNDELATNRMRASALTAYTATPQTGITLPTTLDDLRLTSNCDPRRSSALVVYSATTRDGISEYGPAILDDPDVTDPTPTTTSRQPLSNENLDSLPDGYDSTQHGADLSIDGLTSLDSLTTGSMSVPLAMQLNQTDTHHIVTVEWLDTESSPDCWYVTGIDPTYRNAISLQSATARESNYNAGSHSFTNDNSVSMTVSCKLSTQTTSSTIIIHPETYPILQALQAFNTGEYGTQGFLGGLDILSLIIMLVVMAGFSRSNPIIGIVSALIIMAVFALLGLSTWPIWVFGIIMVVLIFTILNQRRT